MSKSREQLRAVFDDFDKDGNGYLDSAEIVEAAKQLGMEVQQNEVDRVFKQVDKNFDGKITFEEFHTWWRLGGENKMEALVYMKLKSLHLLKRANATAERLGGLLENKYGDSDERHCHLGFCCGEPEEKTSTRFGVDFNNENVETVFQEFSQGLELDAEKITMCLRVKANEGKEEDAQEELQNYFEEVLTMVKQIPGVGPMAENIDFSFGLHEGWVKVGISCNLQMVVDMVEQGKQQLSALLGDKIQLSMNGVTMWDTDVTTILNSTVAQVYPAFKADFDATLKGEALKNLLGGQMERLKEDTPRYKMEKYFACMLGFLFKGGKFQLNLNKVDMSKAMEMSPMGQMKDAQVKDLLKQVVPMAQGMMQQAPPLVKDVLECFKEYFSSELGWCVHCPMLSLQCNLKTSGVADLYTLVFPEE